MTVKYLRTVVVLIIVAYIASMFVLAAQAHTHVPGTAPKYACYNDAQWKIHTVCIPVACISAEDSAAHVYEYAYGNGRVVYRCHHRGY